MAFFWQHGPRMKDNNDYTNKQLRKYMLASSRSRLADSIMKILTIFGFCPREEKLRAGVYYWCSAWSKIGMLFLQHLLTNGFVHRRSKCPNGRSAENKKKLERERLTCQRAKYLCSLFCFHTQAHNWTSVAKHTSPHSELISPKLEPLILHSTKNRSLQPQCLRIDTNNHLH